MLYVLSFLFGASIGSFVLVVATRLNVAPLMRSKSKCLSCGEALRVSDLAPIFSYLFLRGRCRYCKVPFGKEALLVEIFYGFLFVLLTHYMLLNVGLEEGLLWLFYYTLLFISLGVIGIYDYRHSYVPVLFLGMFSFLSFCMLGIRYLYDPTPALLLGPLVVAFPFLLIWLVTKGKAVGLGDVILYGAVGAFFGIEQGLAVLLVSIWVGALVGVGIYLVRLSRGRKERAIPFVPFIVSAFLFVLFTDLSIFSIAQGF